MSDIGPRALEQRYTCDGCPSLKTEWWKDYLDNDETDSGTSADCTAAGKHIDAYWHRNMAPPSWCPALNPSPSPGKSEPREQAEPNPSPPNRRGN